MVGIKTSTVNNHYHTGTLIVRKVVINDNGGTKKASDFSFSLDGNATSTVFALDGDNNHGKNTLTKNAGTYTVTEPAAAGYTTTYDTCSNVVLTNGGTQTCTITNDDQTGTLIVRKVVINDNGGTKTASDFGLSLDGNAASTALALDGDTAHGKTPPTNK